MSETAKPKFIFDFQKLIKTFTEICPDFCAEPSYANATVSRRFAEQVIFEYSKEAKEAKAKNLDEIQRMSLQTKNAQGYLIKNRVTIVLHTRNPAPPNQPSLVDGNLELTFKQASLLAVAKYCQLVPHLVQRDEIVLTPLAGAVFAKEDMPQLARVLNEPLAELVMAIISSCQTDGYYLEHSRCEIALAALIKTVSDLKMRASLVKKTIKMYKLYGKEFDMRRFQICIRFLKPNSSSNRSSNDIEQICSSVMAIDLKADSKPVRPMPKPKMTCAANFSGKTLQSNKK
ncbi:uncharacterized protein LOC6583330 [Drosophila mojavensis]|uniref:Uncharacterized protein n=1 Tax=Drosophila mojavensis TaxID=7230 RepID=B4KVK5_DROMO|nr:uncharacterized protein LOC6583330 [Drosophila mojavensis]EDW19476.1 uncharacterized protein Dmoj_GI13801 [Drosophila mojavensis]